MKQNLTDKICEELELIGFLSKISALAILYESENLPSDKFVLIFEDIEKRCLQLSEYFETPEGIPSGKIPL